jgi:hypothetical protein
MRRIAVSAPQPFAGAPDACAGELDQAGHDFRPAVLQIDGIGYHGWELREKSLTARAAVIDGGWTILACVPHGEEPAVELDYLARKAAA